MGTFYNSRVLEWFEVGRTELSRKIGLPYSEWERRSTYLPLVEAFVRFRGRACYDDELEMTTTVSLAGRARIRFDNLIVHAGGAELVAEGHTIHVVTDQSGSPKRIPDWVLEAVSPD
jgi:acyl-CoA thioester hydrolase